MGYIATNLSKYEAINSKQPFLYSIILSQIFSILGFLVTYYMIPVFKEMTLKAGLFGVDINKCLNYKDEKDPDRKIIPESLGIVPGFVFLAVSITSQTFY